MSDATHIVFKSISCIMVFIPYEELNGNFDRAIVYDIDNSVRNPKEEHIAKLFKGWPPEKMLEESAISSKWQVFYSEVEFIKEYGWLLFI